MVDSRLYLPHFGVCVHTIFWELHNQAHGILPNEHSWSPCYVDANIQLMQHRATCHYVAYDFLGHRFYNCHRSASLRSYVDGVWYCVSGPGLP